MTNLICYDKFEKDFALAANKLDIFFLRKVKEDAV
jgi:hypothetical protein